MGWWELSQIFEDSNPFRNQIILYFRYIDYLIFVCNCNVLIASFLSFLNDNAWNLCFTGQLKSDAINFLDVRLTHACNMVITQLYRKPLAGNSLLSARFSHPEHTIKGIPVGQFLRLWRICSDQIDFERESAALFKRFLARGYPRWTLDRAYCIASRKNSADLLYKGNTCRKKYFLREKDHL